VIPDIRKHHTPRHPLLLQVPQLPLDRLAGARLMGTEIAKEDIILAVRISTGDFWVYPHSEDSSVGPALFGIFHYLSLFRISWNFWE